MRHALRPASSAAAAPHTGRRRDHGARPVPGRLVPLRDVPDATFAQGIVGHGVAIDPPREVVDAVAPVSGTVMKLWPHAYVIMTVRRRRACWCTSASTPCS